MKQLWFGDNLTILREEIATGSVDLVYLDPPFNSKANYNVLFRTPADEAASAQVEAFRDTWTWGNEAQWAFDELLRQGGPVSNIIHALHSALGESDMMAYLVMMAQRIVELRRVLKPTGSLYLHCDQTASHYLKIILDSIFGAKNFRNEIIWKRANAHNDPRGYGRISDTILFYTGSSKFTWNTQYTPYRPEYYSSHFKQDADGRWFRTVPLDAPKHGAGSQNLLYDWNGKLPSLSRTWAVKRETMEEYESKNLLRYTRTGTPTLIQYADEMKGVPLQNIWTDIPPVNPQAKERLGYPTQKPIALLERILKASTNEGDVVLDPFCGCGTTVAAAQTNDRQWIGIDIAFHAIKVIEERILKQDPETKFDVGGVPRDFEGAQRLALKDKFQFQWWANYLVGVQLLKEIKKGPDRGIDGQMYFMNGPRGWGKVLTSVKGGQHVGAKDVREFKAVVDRERAEMGLFICLNDATREMKAEAASFGFVQTAHGHLPRLQIVTIGDWFRGQRPVLPSLGHVSREYFQPEKQQKSKTKRPDVNAPEFKFSFPGTKQEDGAIIHLNPEILNQHSS